MGWKRVRHNWGTFTLLLSLSLVVQWLRLCTLNAGVLGSIPGQGTRSYILQLRVYIPQLKILHTMTKTRLSQINKQVNKWMKELPQGHTVRTRAPPALRFHCGQSSGLEPSLVGEGAPEDNYSKWDILWSAKLKRSLGESGRIRGPLDWGGSLDKPTYSNSAGV